MLTPTRLISPGRMGAEIVPAGCTDASTVTSQDAAARLARDGGEGLGTFNRVRLAGLRDPLASLRRRRP